MKYYVLFVWGDIEPSLEGPFATVEERDAKAHELYDERHGVYMLDVDDNGVPSVDSYSGAFFDEEDE